MLRFMQAARRRHDRAQSVGERARVVLRADPLLVGNYEGDERSVRRARKYIVERAAADEARFSTGRH